MSDESFSFVDLGLALVAIAVALFAVFVIPRLSKDAKAKRVTVNEFEKALLIVKGRVERELGPGQYSTLFTSNTIERYDLVYLRAWEQNVTATEDSELLERALGGPDTSVYRRRMRRLEVLRGKAERAAIRDRCGHVSRGGDR